MKLTEKQLRRLVREELSPDPYDMPDEGVQMYTFPVLDEVQHASDVVEGLYERMTDDIDFDIGHDPGMVPGLDEVLQATEALQGAMKALEGGSGAPVR